MTARRKLTKKEKEEIKLCERLIKLFKKGYGYPCVKKLKDREPTCVACRAQDTIDFLKENIELIKY